MDLESVLNSGRAARAATSDIDEASLRSLYDAMDQGDPLRAAAAWAAAGWARASPIARSDLLARLERDPRALWVTCFLGDADATIDAIVRAVGARLEDPALREDAARALYALVLRGAKLGATREAVVRAQRPGEQGATDYLAFAIAQAERNGEDFAGCEEALAEAFTVRWESARALGSLVDKGLDGSALAHRVVASVLRNDDVAKVARTIVAQAVAKGVAVELGEIERLLHSKDAYAIDRGARCAGVVTGLGVDARRLLPLLEKLAKDKRRSVSAAAASFVAEAGAALDHPRYVAALAATPALSKLRRAALDAGGRSALDEALSRCDADAVKSLLSSAPLEYVGALHARAGRDADAPLLAAALRELIAHEDPVVRFAAIDALARGAAEARCDLRAHAPALIAALREKGRPGYAPGSGAWQTLGLADSAARALSHAARWDETGTVVSLLAGALESRAQQPASLAARALATGLASGGRASELAPWLGHPRAHVREGLLRALVALDAPAPAAIGERVRALREDPDAAVRTAARCVAIEGDPDEDARARAARIADGAWRARELFRLRDAALDAAARRELPAAVAGALDDPQQAVWAAGALARLAEAGATMEPYVSALLGALVAQYAGGRESIARCLTVARAQGAALGALTAAQRAALAKCGAAGLLSPDPGAAWNPDSLKALRAMLALGVDEGHPSTFAEQRVWSERAAELLARARVEGASLTG